MEFTGEVWQWAVVFVGAIVLFVLVFFGAMARFLRRPSPSEALIRIGRTTTDVFIGRACWVVPVLHRAATISLSTIGLTIRRVSHDALVSKDFISTNLSAEFYIRIEPNEDDIKKSARTIGVEEGQANSDHIRMKAQQLLEPKLIGALRAVAAQSDFLTLHLQREHFAEGVSHALREDLGRNGFTLESVTITELTQTPLEEMRTNDIFGASGRETVTNTVIQKNIAVKRKQQEEAERTAEIQKMQEITVAQQSRLLREGKAKEEEAAAKAEIAKNEAVETRDLQRQGVIATERAKKEQAEQTAELVKQKAVEAAQVDKERTIEAALVDKQITLTLKAKESAEADAQKAAALALREKADQEVITVQQVSEADRAKQVAIVSSQKAAEQMKIAADVEAYKKRVEAEALAAAQKAAAEGKADAQRMEAQGASDSVKIKAKADADAAELQALSITKLAEANRQAGLKEAEVLREKILSANGKSRDILLQEAALAFLEQAPAIARELVKPAEKISELKILQMPGGGNGNGAVATHGMSSMLGSTVGPIMKTIMEASAMMPIMQSMMKLADGDQVKDAMAKLVAPRPEPPTAAGSMPAPPPPGRRNS